MQRQAVDLLRQKVLNGDNSLQLQAVATGRSVQLRLSSFHQKAPPMPKLERNAFKEFFLRKARWQHNNNNNNSNSSSSSNNNNSNSNSNSSSSSSSSNSRYKSKQLVGREPIRGSGATNPSLSNPEVGAMCRSNGALKLSALVIAFVSCNAQKSPDDVEVTGKQGHMSFDYVPEVAVNLTESDTCSCSHLTWSMGSMSIGYANATSKCNFEVGEIAHLQALSHDKGMNQSGTFGGNVGNDERNGNKQLVQIIGAEQTAHENEVGNHLMKYGGVVSYKYSVMDGSFNFEHVTEPERIVGVLIVNYRGVVADVTYDADNGTLERWLQDKDSQAIGVIETESYGYEGEGDFGTDTQVNDVVETPLWWRDLIFVNPLELDLPLECDTFEIGSRGQITRRVRRRSRRSMKEARDRGWYLTLKYDPSAPGHCFYQCLAQALWADGEQYMCMRTALAKAWLGSSCREVLREVARMEGCSPWFYVISIRYWRWGGMPEAWIAAQTFGRPVCVWDQAAKLIYSFKPTTQICDRKVIHLGLHREHYVLLHHRPVLGQPVQGGHGAARGGAPKTLLKSRREVEEDRRQQYQERVDAGIYREIDAERRSQMSFTELLEARRRWRHRVGMPYAERLPNEPESPEELGARQRPARDAGPVPASGLQDASVNQSTEPASILYMEGEEHIDGLPLSREERERIVHQNLAFWTSRADQLEQMAADEPVEENYPGAKPKKMPRREALREPPIVDAQVVPSSPEHEKEVEVLEPAGLRKADGSLNPYHPSWVDRMKKAMEEKLLAEKKAGLKKKDLTVEKAHGSDKKDKAADIQISADPDPSAKQLLDSAKEEGTLHTRQSWLKLATWSDSSGEGQDYFCNLCHKWANSGHLMAPRHLRKQRQYEANYIDDGGFDLDVRERPSVPRGNSPPPFGFPHSDPASSSSRPVQPKIVVKKELKRGGIEFLDVESAALVAYLHIKPAHPFVTFFDVHPVVEDVLLRPALSARGGMEVSGKIETEDLDRSHHGERSLCACEVSRVVSTGTARPIMPSHEDDTP